jgi:hypothetical protein
MTPGLVRYSGEGAIEPSQPSQPEQTMSTERKETQQLLSDLQAKSLETPAGRREAELVQGGRRAFAVAYLRVR